MKIFGQIKLILCILIIIGMAAYGGYDLATYLLFSQAGITTSGVVENVEASRSRRSPSLRLTISYYDSLGFEHRIRPLAPALEGYSEPGVAVPIVYDRARPEIATIKDFRTRAHSAILLFFGVLATWAGWIHLAGTRGNAGHSRATASASPAPSAAPSSRATPARNPAPLARPAVYRLRNRFISLLILAVICVAAPIALPITMGGLKGKLIGWGFALFLAPPILSMAVRFLVGCPAFRVDQTGIKYDHGIGRLVRWRWDQITGAWVSQVGGDIRLFITVARSNRGKTRLETLYEDYLGLLPPTGPRTIQISLRGFALSLKEAKAIAARVGAPPRAKSA